MKLFGVVATTALLATACSAQDRTPVEDPNGFLRTPICEDVGQTDDQLPALARGNIGTNLGAGANLGALGLVGRGRNRRQAPEKFDPKKTPFVWYTNPKAQSGDDCEAGAGQAVLNRGPVIVPLGTYNVCVKFDKANRWFYTKGSNAPCDPTNRCCEWFPPRQCTRTNQVPVWFELKDAASCAEAFSQGAKPGLGVEYLQNKAVGEPAAICIHNNPEDSEEEADFDLVQVTTAYCGEGCCIFDRN